MAHLKCIANTFTESYSNLACLHISLELSLNTFTVSLMQCLIRNKLLPFFCKYISPMWLVGSFIMLHELHGFSICPNTIFHNFHLALNLLDPIYQYYFFFHFFFVILYGRLIIKLKYLWFKERWNAIPPLWCTRWKAQFLSSF